MKDILGKHLEQIKDDILNYLSCKSEHFSDKRILKFLKILAIGAADESEKQELYAKIQSFLEQVNKSKDQYDLKWLSILYVNLVNVDFQEVAFLLQQLDYSLINNDVSDDLDLLRRLSQVIYWENYEEIIPALERLTECAESEYVDTETLLWTMYHQDFDVDKAMLLINMCNTIIKYRPNDYHAFFFLGFIYVELEQYQYALEAHLACLDICKSKPLLQDHISWEYMRIADCYLSLNDIKKTVVYSTAALESFEKFNANEEFEIPFFQAVYTLRNKAYLNLKHYQLALNDINQLLVYSPRDKSIRQLKKKVEKFC